MQIENKEMPTVTKALIVYAQYLERKTERLEQQVLSLKVEKPKKVDHMMGTL